MDRQRGRPPHRQSSLPSSLHRFMVPGPTQPRRSTTQEGEGRTSTEEGEDPLRPAPSAPAHPIPSAPLLPPQPLPGTHLSQAVFDEEDESSESEGRPSISPAPRTVSRDVGSAAARPALTIPPLPPPLGVLRSDPAYYVSMPMYPATYSIPPPGPPLPPISWWPPRAPGEPAVVPPLATSDRGDPGPPQFFPQPPPRLPSYSPTSPVAGPSRPREEPRPRRPRRGRAAKSQATAPPQEAAFLSGATPESQIRGGSGDTSRGELPAWTRARSDVNTSRIAESASTSRAPPSGLPVEGSGAAQRGTLSVPIPPSERGPSPRRAPHGSRRSPASSVLDSFPVTVGPTAYHVTTLSPFRTTAPPLANEPEPSAPAALPIVGTDPPAPAAEAAETTEPQEQAEQPESDTATTTTGKRKRGPRGDKDKSSGSSESSEVVTVPKKGKKVPIACNYCRCECSYLRLYSDRLVAAARTGLSALATSLELRADVFFRDGSPKAALRWRVYMCPLCKARLGVRVR